VHCSYAFPHILVSSNYSIVAFAIAHTSFIKLIQYSSQLREMNECTQRFKFLLSSTVEIRHLLLIGHQLSWFTPIRRPFFPAKFPTFPHYFIWTTHHLLQVFRNKSPSLNTKLLSSSGEILELTKSALVS